MKVNVIKKTEHISTPIGVDSMSDDLRQFTLRVWGGDKTAEEKRLILDQDLISLGRDNLKSKTVMLQVCKTRGREFARHYLRENRDFLHKMGWWNYFVSELKKAFSNGTF